MTGVPAKAVESVRSDWGAILGLRVAMIRKSWPFSWPATFRKKWPVGPRRCPMSAKADAEAAAALRELGATLKASKEEGHRGKPGGKPAGQGGTTSRIHYHYRT